MKTRGRFYFVASLVTLVAALLLQGMTIAAGALGGGFIAHAIADNLDGAYSVYAADVDGDGDVDFLGAAYLADDIIWWENDGSEHFTEHVIDDNFNGAQSVYATDLDDDGDVDVLGAAHWANDVTWWENDGSEHFTEHTIEGSFNGARSVYATDLDGDGDVDVLGAAFFADDITWWENDGSEHFTGHTVAGDFDGAGSVWATDVDGDADVDILGAASLADDITWWENDGSELFTEHTIAGDFDAAGSVYTIDLDEDGDVDVLGVAFYADDITWWENDGSELFTEHTIDGDFDGANSVDATDLDGDGDVDVLGAATYADDITWWENDGSEHFTKHTIEGNFDGAYSVFGTDVDGDSDVDVLGAAYNADDVTWWEQVSNFPPTLYWTGETNYLSDGLHPESGETSEDYVYRIKYADGDGDPPAYVRVHIEKGGADIVGSPFTLNCASGDYTTGVVCTYTKAGLAAGGDYTYYFVAQDDQGGPATPTTVLDGPDVTCRLYLPAVLKDFVPPPLPSVPVLDGISNPDGDGDYTVSWGAASDATSYTLEEDDNAAFSSPTTVYSGPDTSTSITGRGVGTYYYRVRASNASGSSEWSNVESVVVTGPVPPSAPVLDGISNPDGDGDYTVSWSAVSDATSYTLQEDDNAAFSSPTTMYSGPDTSTLVTGRDVGTYYYRARASNASGSSDWSNVELVTVTVPPPYDWMRLSTGITATLRGVHFVDVQNGWVVGSDGTILHTMDSGQSWQRQESGTTEGLYDVFFVDQDRGWVVSSYLILRTTDGGDTWGTQTSPISTDFCFKTINFADSDHGWIGAGKIESPEMWRFYLYGHVLRTTDGGDSWSSAKYFGHDAVDDLYFVDATHGWLIATTYDNYWKKWWQSVYATADGGLIWWKQSTSTTEGSSDLNAVTFADASTGWVVMDAGLVLHTINGGANWSEDSLSTSVDLNGVQFVGSANGWIHSDGSIWHTADSGDTWVAQTTEPGCTGFNDFHFVDVDHGWVVGDNGVVCKSH